MAEGRLIPTADGLGTFICVLYDSDEVVGVKEILASRGGNNVARVQYGINMTCVFAVVPLSLSKAVSTLRLPEPFPVRGYICPSFGLLLPPLPMRR